MQVGDSTTLGVSISEKDWLAGLNLIDEYTSSNIFEEKYSFRLRKNLNPL